MLKNGKYLLILALVFINSANAGLEKEINEQIKIESTLDSRLKEAKTEADSAYHKVFEFYEDDPTNREEKIRNLEESSSAWNDFIEKTCLFESNETIGTRSENTTKLKCMIEKYRSKAQYYRNSI